jgi:hypothetical protein
VDRESTDVGDSSELRKGGGESRGRPARRRGERAAPSAVDFQRITRYEEDSLTHDVLRRILPLRPVRYILAWNEVDEEVELVRTGECPCDVALVQGTAFARIRV